MRRRCFCSFGADVAFCVFHRHGCYRKQKCGISAQVATKVTEQHLSSTVFVSLRGYMFVFVCTNSKYFNDGLENLIFVIPNFFIYFINVFISVSILFWDFCWRISIFCSCDWSCCAAGNICLFHRLQIDTVLKST